MNAPASPERPTLVLLHSSGASPRQWHELVEATRHERRVLAVEFHGHGSRPDWSQPRPMTLADEALLAHPLLEMAGGAHLIGHSYGGAVALKLASMYPQLVRGIVVYEPVLLRLLAEDAAQPQHVREVVRVAQALRARLRAQRVSQAAQLFVDFWSGPGAWDALPPGAQQATEARMPSIMRQFDPLFHEPFAREQLARLQVPMLFLHGSRTTPVAQRIAHLLREAFPHADHEELPGMGHLGPITHPHPVNERIRRFLCTSTPRTS